MTFLSKLSQVQLGDVRGQAVLVDSVPESAAEVRAELHAAGGEVLLQARQKGRFIIYFINFNFYILAIL